MGCGDGRVAAKLPFKVYTGVDAVGQVIAANRKRWPDCNWLVSDAMDAELLPAADVLLMKDVLHHLPNQMIDELLTGIITAKKWKTLVLCFDCDLAKDGADCPVGYYRPLDGRQSPLKKFGLTEMMRFKQKVIMKLDLNDRTDL